ncbi:MULTISPECIES: ABC transporter permease [Arenibacter]|uniref:ABC transporter permease n=1 Tax=Arenibacter TaxID=178469 RepID=UPI001EFDB273|nr:MULTISPECIES: ABC transporter permease [Arenibacter]
MVTKIINLDKERVTTEFKVTEDCIFVKNNRFTESGIIENAAQSCSAIVGQDFFAADDLEGEGNSVIGYISGIKKANILLLPKLGDTLITKAKLVSNYSSGNFSICTMDCKIYTDEVLVADCILNFLIQEV